MRQVPGAPCVAILFSLRRAAAEGLAGRVVRPMPAAPFGEGEDMNPMDVALEALYLLGVLMCCALLSRVYCFNVCWAGSAVFFRSVG